MPRISVIMSVCNEPIDWIRQSIDSILAQTYYDYEFIIVNDRPERLENSRILEEYKNRDKRVHILSNEYNLGLTKSLNRALDIARGDFIARMDADDISLPHRFDTQVSYLDSHPEICACGSWTGSIDEKGERLPGISKYETNSKWIRAQFLQNSQVAHPSAMFRRVVDGYSVRYNEEVRYAQDYSLWVSMLPYGKITNIPEILFCYRISGQQITSIKTQEQQICAGVAQRKAFELFDFHASEDFLKLFYSLTIQHNMNVPLAETTCSFISFFSQERLTKDNSLGLEIIYSSYLSFLRHHSNGSVFGFLRLVLFGSSMFMIWIGVLLCRDLLLRKFDRKQL